MLNGVKLNLVLSIVQNTSIDRFSDIFKLCVYDSEKRFRNGWCYVLGPCGASLNLTGNMKAGAVLSIVRRVAKLLPSSL